ncbi:hypothetical protein D9M73_247950 [compost metagenome]
MRINEPAGPARRAIDPGIALQRPAMELPFTTGQDRRPQPLAPGGGIRRKLFVCAYRRAMAWP